MHCNALCSPKGPSHYFLAILRAPILQTQWLLSACFSLKTQQHETLIAPNPPNKDSKIENLLLLSKAFQALSCSYIRTGLT